MSLYNESLLDIPEGEISECFEEVPNAADELLGDAYKRNLLTEVHLTSGDFAVQTPQRCSFKLLFVRRDNYLQLRKMIRETIPLCVVGKSSNPFINVQGETEKKLETLFADNYWIIPLRKSPKGFSFEGIRLSHNRTDWIFPCKLLSIRIVDIFVAGYIMKERELLWEYINTRMFTPRGSLSLRMNERMDAFTKDLSHELAALEDIR